jgi:hypothetical protein
MNKLCSFAGVSLYCVVGLGAGASAQSTSQPTPAPSATGKVVGPDAKPQIGVPMVVQGPSGTTTAFTDDKDQWFLYNLKPGKYEVKPAVTPSQPQVIFTVEGTGMFWSKQQNTYRASDMKLNRDWNTIDGGS